MGPAYYIRLGERRIWETACLRDGTLRLGYHLTPHADCLAGAWTKVAAFWTKERNCATGTRYTNQIRIFYEADEATTFVTITRGRLFFCKPTGPVELLQDSGRERRTVNGWRDTDERGRTIRHDRLFDELTKMVKSPGFTIRSVKSPNKLHALLDGE